MSVRPVEVRAVAVTVEVRAVAVAVSYAVADR